MTTQNPTVPLAAAARDWSWLTFFIRRLALGVFVAGSTATAAFLMSEILGADGWTVLRMVEMGLFAISFTGLAISFWMAVMGFITRLIGGDPASLLTRTDMTAPLQQRTALVMPIYNEDTHRVVAGLEATLRSLEALPEHQHFELFVLSDTRKQEIAEAETAAISALKQRHKELVPVHYRRRERNIGRKAGNITEFVERWGAGYAHMIVLDADSVMSGATLVALTRTMEQHPQAGLIQTIPTPVNRETPFARILQFANRLYGPIMASGLAFWSGGDGNYYGHNAIIRLDAFAAHCGLPKLPGRAPLGGEILSHDFVEAALIRRAGYRVWVVPELDGSYEEMPANVIDYATRDRRWAQGNLQHSKVMTLPRLNWASRMHMLMGIMGYVSSPLWVLLLALASIDIGEKALAPIVYFKPGFNLFPSWPVARYDEIGRLLFITLAALFLPKLLGLFMVVFSRSRRRSFGGFRGLLTSVVLETLFSALLAPVMALFQSLFVLTTLGGHSVSWEAQPRDDRGLAWREAVKRHIGHMVIGLVWGTAMLLLTPQFFWWLSPFLAGLVFAIPVSTLSSRSSLGIWLKRRGLFLIPEETAPPIVLADLNALLANKFAAASETIEANVLVTPKEHPLAMPIPSWGRRQLRPTALPILSKAAVK